MLLLSQREQNKQGEARAGSITPSVGTFFAPWPLSQLCLCSFLHITPKCKSLWCYQDPSVCWGKSYCSPSPDCLFIPALFRLLCPYGSFIHSLTHLDDRLKDSPGFSDSSLFWTSLGSPCVCVCVCVHGCVGGGWGGRKCFHLRFLVCAWSLAGQTHQVFLTFLSVLTSNQPPNPLQASGKLSFHSLALLFLRYQLLTDVFLDLGKFLLNEFSKLLSHFQSILDTGTKLNLKMTVS